MFHLTGRNQISHGSCNIFNGYVQINPVLLIEVDRVGPESLQRSLNRFFDVFRAAVQSKPLSAVRRIGLPAELGCDRHLSAERCKRLSDEIFIRLRTVDLSGIEERHAAVYSGMKQRDHLLLVLRSAV